MTDSQLYHMIILSQTRPTINRQTVSREAMISGSASSTALVVCTLKLHCLVLKVKNSAPIDWLSVVLRLNPVIALEFCFPIYIFMPSGRGAHTWSWNYSTGCPCRMVARYSPQILCWSVAGCYRWSIYGSQSGRATWLPVSHRWLRSWRSQYKRRRYLVHLEKRWGSSLARAFKIDFYRLSGISVHRGYWLFSLVSSKIC